VKNRKNKYVYIYLLYQQNMTRNNGICYQNPLLCINFDLDYDKKSDFFLSLDLGI